MMTRPLLLATGSALAGLLSFFTLLLPRAGALAHLGENATWGLVLGAVVLALLAVDGAKGSPRIRALVIIGLVAGALRAGLLFLPTP